MSCILALLFTCIHVLGVDQHRDAGLLDVLEVLHALVVVLIEHSLASCVVVDNSFSYALRQVLDGNAERGGGDHSAERFQEVLAEVDPVLNVQEIGSWPLGHTGAGEPSAHQSRCT